MGKALKKGLPFFLRWLIKRFAVHGDVTAVTVRACGSVDTDEGPDHGSNEQRGSEKVGRTPFLEPFLYQND